MVTFIIRSKNAIDLFYSRTVLAWPKFTLLLSILSVCVLAIGLQTFRIDASGDSLLLEADKELEFYRTVRTEYGADDYLILTYTTPEKDVFSEAALADLTRLREALAKISEVAKITSILDVPLFESPPVSGSDITSGAPHLLDKRTNLELARIELSESPLYRNRILSNDARTTAMQIDLRLDKSVHKLVDQRNRLRAKRTSQRLNKDERRELRSIVKQIDVSRRAQDRTVATAVAEVRSVMEQHPQTAKLQLGGLPVIRTDMLDYIRSDLAIFGSALIIVLTALLALIFRRPRWVLVPLAVCALTLIGMAGILGIMRWPVTVVSSNFVSLLLILTLSLNVHLAVRYRELCAEDDDSDQAALIRATVRSKFFPALLTAISTMAAFASLTIAGIRPVIDFGWMMVAGIALGFVLTFIVLPATMMLFDREYEAPAAFNVERLMAALGKVAIKQTRAIPAVTVLVSAISVYGLSQLSVDNRFIDYFDESTEIHKGLSLIDRELGGTIPLDVVIDSPPRPSSSTSSIDDEIELTGSAGFAADSYWMNGQRLADVEAVHDFLQQRSGIGSVLSLDTTMYVFRQLSGDDAVDSFGLSVIYERLPKEVKNAILWPYISDSGDQTRLAVRIYETKANLDRDAMLADIRRYITKNIGVVPEHVHLTGVFVLYNNVLKSLLESQLKTAGFVIVLVLSMFTLAFRSIRVAVISLVPNLLGAAFVLAAMAALSMPLDIMTITIAAIAIGIGVDDTIHYVHRYREEIAGGNDVDTAIENSHRSVGQAIFFTTVTIVLGFSVLGLSNFVPTLYFGLLTAFAMVIALVADLTLLPFLLKLSRAFNNA